MRGTLLNTVTVAAGATVGILLGSGIRDDYKQVALHGLGLVTVGIGVQMFLKVKNPLIAAAAVAVGGILGLALGIHSGIEGMAGWLKMHLEGSHPSHFSEGLITSFVLFCIGPMTLLGCIQDALEHKIDLLALKSTMDGIAAVFLAAASGYGVLVTAVLVFLFQGGLTLLAKQLRPLAADEECLAGLSGAGGAILMATGLGLIGLTDLHTANYLPAIFLAPLLVLAARKLPKFAGGAA